jgi:transposase-like protein
MKHRRSFAIELKRQIIEELLSGVSTPAQLIRRYDISRASLSLEEQYARGRLTMNPVRSSPEDRVRQLEQLVGRLTWRTSF